MVERNRSLAWTLLAVALTFPVLVARAVWQADWLYFVALGLLCVAGMVYLRWQWRGSKRELLLFVALMTTVVAIAFAWEKLFG